MHRLKKIATAAALGMTLAGCAVENLTVHNFRTMGMDQDSAAIATQVIESVAK